MEELMKKKRSENIMIESNNSEINNTNMRLNAKNIELEAQIKQLQKKASMSEAKLTRQKNETDRRSIEMLEVQSELDKLDNAKGIVEKQLELTIANKDFIIQNLRDTIKVYDTRD
jgi:AraC-like DNA-binding protein